MIQLLVIADDFTGALDTGIQFVKKGIHTQIGTGEHLEKVHISPEAQVLVLDLETRPLSPLEAYNKVADAVKWAKQSGISRIYKKTDSALRGNIGSELTAVMDAFGERELFFIPAFPRMGRYTKGGVQYLEGVPLSETSFGKDLFEPITCSYIPDLISQQSAARTVSIETGSSFTDQKAGEEKIIYIFDAETNEDIKAQLAELKKRQKLTLLAGCAGCAEYLTEALGLNGDKRETYTKSERLLISCGSLNPITKKQIDYLEDKGIARIHLTGEQRVNPEYCSTKRGQQFLDRLEEVCLKNKVVMIDTLDDMQETPLCGERFLVARSQGRIIKEMLKRMEINTVLMTGGDTLMGFLSEMDNPQLMPVCELNQGTVLSRIQIKDRQVQVISKSGGFGKEEILEEIIEEIVV